MHAYARDADDELGGLRSVFRAMGAGGRGGGGGRHRHHGPRSFGRGGPGGPAFGGFGPGGPPWRGRKARRGDIRTATLLLLAEEPRNGYQIMQEVEERSGGLWSPSPGSVYPALQQLEDEGLIRAEEVDGRRAFTLTDAGREEVAKRDADAPAPWDEQGGQAGQRVQLGQALRATAAAAAEVLRTGNEAQLTQAQTILAAARRDLYRVLAEDGGDDPGEGAQAS